MDLARQSMRQAGLLNPPVAEEGTQQAQVQQVLEALRPELPRKSPRTCAVTTASKQVEHHQ
eukprot:1901231-Prorocentrum_lima.AAC.1